MCAGIAGRLETAVRSHEHGLGFPASVDLDACAEAIPIGRTAESLDLNPMTGGQRVIAQQNWGAIKDREEHIFMTCIPEICHGSTSSDVAVGQGRPGLFANLLKGSVLQVVKQKGALGIGDTEGMRIDLGIHVAIRDPNVLPAVIVEVEKLRSKGEERDADGPKV